MSVQMFDNVFQNVVVRFIATTKKVTPFWCLDDFEKMQCLAPPLLIWKTRGSCGYIGVIDTKNVS